MQTFPVWCWSIDASRKNPARKQASGVNVKVYPGWHLDVKGVSIILHQNGFGWGRLLEKFFPI